MKLQYDPKTKIYSCRITIGEKEPIPFNKLSSAMQRAISGVLGKWHKQQIKILTDILFWFEEGYL